MCRHPLPARSLTRSRAASSKERIDTAVTLLAHPVPPITVSWTIGRIVQTSSFGLISRMVAMLAEIFIVRLEAERRLVREVLPVEQIQLYTVQPKEQRVQGKRPQGRRGSRRRPACHTGPITEGLPAGGVSETASPTAHVDTRR